ncbi:MAG: replication factor C large subunit [Candidatus Thorarchaeota archaeon]|nr:MAG: replication factor C large subunit [Candidatus Thorarchaeota archaeon]
MKNEKLPWPERYRPEFLKEIVGNIVSVKGLRNWIESWVRGTPSVKAVLLIGPPGVGKTASIGALSRDYDLELVEFNSSDKRNKGVIENHVWKAATQQTLDGRLRIILLDEVDGLSGTSDRGGVNAILKIIDETGHPIVMTANDPHSPRLRSLVKKCKVFTFTHIESKHMLDVLRKIVATQGLELSDEKMEEIIGQSGGDLRAAISDLETVLVGEHSPEEILSSRDIRRDVEEVLRRLFMTTDPGAARQVISELDVDHRELLLWLEENVQLHLLTPKELELGLEFLSLADLSLGRIMRGQNWKLLAYIYDFLSAGIATSRTETPYRNVQYSRPTWPLLMWQGKRKRDKQKDLLAALSAVAGVSRDRAIGTYGNAISEIVRRSPGLRKTFSSWLGVKGSFLD